MYRRYSAALTALFVLSVTSLAHAQQGTSDTGMAKSSRDRTHDQRALTTDTMGLHQDVAVRDSARATLAQDRTQRQTDQAQFDSLKATLKRSQQATPRDSAAINRNLAAVNHMRQKVDRDQDKTHRQEQRLDVAEKRVRKPAHSVTSTNQH